MNTKSILFQATGIIVFIIVLISCKKTTSGIDDAENIRITDEGMSISEAQYLSELSNYRFEVVEVFEANDTLMRRFKESLDKESKSGNPYYKNQIVELDQKEREMKKRMEDYHPKGKADWELFKEQFTYDLDSLHREYKNLTVKKTVNHTK